MNPTFKCATYNTHGRRMTTTCAFTHRQLPLTTISCSQVICNPEQLHFWPLSVYRVAVIVHSFRVLIYESAWPSGTRHPTLSSAHTHLLFANEIYLCDNWSSRTGKFVEMYFPQSVHGTCRQYVQHLMTFGTCHLVIQLRKEK